MFLGRLQTSSGKLGFCLLLLCFVTHQGKGESFTTCHTVPVEEGHAGLMNISLRQQIDLDSVKIFMYLRRGTDPDTLRCDRKTAQSPLHCEIINSEHFKSEGLVDRNIMLTLPNVTVDLAGLYELRVYVNDVPDPTTKCSLTVWKGTEGQHSAASVENNSDAVPVVVPIVLLILVAIFVTIGVVIFRRRKRKPKKEQENQPEEIKPMTASEDEKNLAEEKGQLTCVKVEEKKTALIGMIDEENHREENKPIKDLEHEENQSSGFELLNLPEESFEIVRHTDVPPNAPAEEVNTGTSTDTTDAAATDKMTPSCDSDRIAPATTPSETTTTTTTTTTDTTATPATDGDEAVSATPVKRRAQLSSRQAGRPTRKSLNTKKTDRETPIGTSLKQAVEKDESPFTKMKAPKRSRPAPEEEQFVTAFGTELK